jgi:hypothetical protein
MVYDQIRRNSGIRGSALPSVGSSCEANVADFSTAE